VVRSAILTGVFWSFTPLNGRWFIVNRQTFGLRSKSRLSWKILLHRFVEIGRRCHCRCVGAECAGAALTVGVAAGDDDVDPWIVRYLNND